MRLAVWEWAFYGVIGAVLLTVLISTGLKRPLETVAVVFCTIGLLVNVGMLVMGVVAP